MTDGVYRRRIELRPSAGVVAGAMEDYVHHFAIRLHHDEGVISGVDIGPERVPWTTCPVGAAGLAALVGVGLDDVAAIDGWMGGRSAQCVHTVDLAVLSAAAALRGGDRTYEVWVEPLDDGTRVASLIRDGDPWATWRIRGGEMVDDGGFAGLHLGREAFSTWIREHLGPDDAEAAFVLRRGAFIGMSRTYDMDALSGPGGAHGPDESCHTYRSDVIEVSFRNRGTTRFTEEDGVGAPIRPAAVRSVRRHGAGGDVGEASPESRTG